jgi:hypothetical protein
MPHFLKTGWQNMLEEPAEDLHMHPGASCEGDVTPRGVTRK